MFVNRSEEPSAMLKSFNDIIELADNFNENLKNQGLSFDPSYFKAHKEVRNSHALTFSFFFFSFLLCVGRKGALCGREWKKEKKCLILEMKRLSRERDGNETKFTFRCLRGEQCVSVFFLLNTSFFR